MKNGQMIISLINMDICYHVNVVLVVRLTDHFECLPSALQQCDLDPFDHPLRAFLPRMIRATIATPSEQLPQETHCLRLPDGLRQRGPVQLGESVARR